MRIKPREGISVFYPDRPILLPPEGAEVTAQLHYWYRRIKDGDVVIINDD